MSAIRVAGVGTVLLGAAVGSAQASYDFTQITIPPPAGSAIASQTAAGEALSINDRGQVLVSALGFLPTQPFPDNVIYNAIYDINTKSFTPLSGVPGSVANSTVGQGINNSGAIVGYYDAGDGAPQGFSYSGGKFAKVAPFGAGYVTPYGISNNGKIAGGTLTLGAGGAPVSGQGFIGAGPTAKPVQPIAPSGNYAVVHAINDAGVGVGYFGSLSGGNQQGFVVDAIGAVTPIVVPGAPLIVQGVGINDSGLILGTVAYDMVSAEGFLDQNGVFTYLNFPGSIFTDAIGLNNAGDVVGEYLAPDGSIQAFVATPAPEPGSRLILVSGLIGLGVAARARVRRTFEAEA